MHSTEAPQLCGRLAEQALRLLNALDAEQCAAARCEFASAQRREWHYTPVERPGLMLGRMDAEQRDAALRLLDVLCSARGAELARGVIAHETLLAEWETLQGVRDVAHRSPERYWVRIYGDPGGGDAPWGVSFSGHHLVLNATVKGGQVSLMPAFWGANPAEVRHGARAGFKLLRPEEEQGRALLMMLTEEQRRIAVASPEPPWDIVTRNRASIEGGVPVPRGIALAEMSAEQGDALAGLVRLYVERLHDDVAGPSWRELERERLAGWGFVWRGALGAGRPHYYALYSGELLIEYDNTQNGGNHVHTVMRSRGADWGEDLLGRHYKEAHGGGG